jgi:hypothetical protein
MPKAEVRSDTHLPKEYPLLTIFQSNQGQMLNNFISGTIGGFVGTVINTPYVHTVPCHTIMTLEVLTLSVQI